MQVARHFLQRKTVHGRERKDDRVFRRRGLQFEIELAAEALAQGQAPRAIDAIAVRRMDDELGTAAFVEETLHDQTLLCGQQAEPRLGPAKILPPFPPPTPPVPTFT